MVYRKRRFTEIDGEKLLEATKTFSKAIFEADHNAPFGSEIHKTLQKLSLVVHEVQCTVTGDSQYGVAPAHSSPRRGSPPPKPIKFRTWDTKPL